MALYKDYLIVCKAILDEEGQFCKLDLAFPIYGQNVCCEGVNYGVYPLPAKLNGKEVLAVITVSTHEQIDTWGGKNLVTVANNQADADKLDGKITDFQTDARVVKHWSVKKEDAYATTSDLGVTTKYSGTDKDEKAPFCVSAMTMKEAELKLCSISIN